MDDVGRNYGKDEALRQPIPGGLHKTLRVTPAMEAGVSDHVWSLEEIAMLVG